MQENTAACISSSSSLHRNQPGGFKAASVLLCLLCLRVDSPAGKLRGRSHLELLSRVVRWQLWLETLRGSAEAGTAGSPPLKFQSLPMRSVLKGGRIAPMGAQGS